MTQDQKGILVMDYLQDLGMEMISVGIAIDIANLEQSYQLIKNNPNITLKEFEERFVDLREGIEYEE